MNRIDQLFNSLRHQNKKGLIGYLTAGDPDMDSSLKNFIIAAKAGVDILEVGVPFSDPTADGPVIQAASQRALSKGCNVYRVMRLVEQFRKNSNAPVILFGYANPFYRYGFERLCKDAVKAGVDGLLVVDMPYEESEGFRKLAGKHGLDWIILIAPTTDEKRARFLLKEATGFVYYITVTGVTGTRKLVPSDVIPHIKQLRKITTLPIAAGFGISNGQQAAQIAKTTDAVVVGSSLIKAMLNGKIEQFVREIRSSLDRL